MVGAVQVGISVPELQDLITLGLTASRFLLFADVLQWSFDPHVDPHLFKISTQLIFQSQEIFVNNQPATTIASDYTGGCGLVV